VARIVRLGVAFRKAQSVIDSLELAEIVSLAG
jgi:hypothetical protein